MGDAIFTDYEMEGTTVRVARKQHPASKWVYFEADHGMDIVTAWDIQRKAGLDPYGYGFENFQVKKADELNPLHLDMDDTESKTWTRWRCYASAD